jgi:hypothetical protein
MALPVTIPNEFANATASIPLSQLDTNFNTLANAVNGISDGSETLANASVTVLTAGTVDINGGNIDGTAIGGSTPDAGSFTTLNTSGAVVFNDAGADVDFRVEGDTEANLLFVDASTDRVGIGTNTPSYALDITNSASGLRLGSDVAGYRFFRESTGGDAGLLQIYGSQSGFNGYIFDSVDGERMRIDTSGNLLVGTTSVIGVGAQCNILGSGNVLHIRSTSAGANNFVSYNSAGSATATLSNAGALTISGALSKGSGSFRIDHPLKPNTHQLVHSFIEGPQADLIYRGKVELVAGRAEVNIDTVAGMTEGTFVALNREVQCFTSNESDWDAVRGSVSGNILTIECQNAESTSTISWLVIGERQDKHMYDTDWTDENGKVIVEPLKPVGGN